MVFDLFTLGGVVLAVFLLGGLVATHDFHHVSYSEDTVDADPHEHG